MEGIRRQRISYRWPIVESQCSFCDGVKRAADLLSTVSHYCKWSLKIITVYQGYLKLLFMQWKVFQDKEMNADGWLSHCSVFFVMASKKAVDYMIEPIHCCKHPMKIALVFQGYPESLFVSWKAFDDKEVNRPAFRCVVARFSWRRKNELPILCTQWVVITSDCWWVLWCIKVIQSFYLYHGRQSKIMELAPKANCSLAARFWLGIEIGCRFFGTWQFVIAWIRWRLLRYHKAIWSFYSCQKRCLKTKVFLPKVNCCATARLLAWTQSGLPNSVSSWFVAVSVHWRTLRYLKAIQEFVMFQDRHSNKRMWVPKDDCCILLQF